MARKILEDLVTEDQVTDLDDPDPQSGSGSSGGSLPLFSDLVKNYPTTSDYKAVIRSINPRYENEPAYQNTCAMRLSKSLNYCKGHEIPKKQNLYCIIGVDKKRYAVRVREMKKYIRDKYSKPDFELTAAKGVIDKSSILGKQGIIVFDVSGWSDASGHFSLWDGSKVLYDGGHDYFDLYEVDSNNKIIQVTKCYLWLC